MTPAHCRAARALLGWSQKDLAMKAKVSTSTVSSFESGVRQPIPNNIDAIAGAFVVAGIEDAARRFLDSITAWQG